MAKDRFETGKAPSINVAECRGELVIRGWTDTEVLVRGEEFKVNEGEAGLIIESNSRLSLMVPAATSLSLSRVEGDLVVKNVSGKIVLNEVAGDAIFLGTADVKLDTIRGDLSAKRISGSVSAGTIHGDGLIRTAEDLNVGTIHGDLSARYLNGVAQLGEVMGDLHLRNVAGDVTVKKVHRDANLLDLGGANIFSDVRGDIRLNGRLGQGKHSFTAAGDIVMGWPVDAPINLEASGSSISNKLSFDEVDETNGNLTGRIGDDSTVVSLSAKGRIILKDIQVAEEKWEWDQSGEPGVDISIDLEGLGERISMQVNEHIARITTDLERKFGPEYSQKITEKIARKAEWAAAKAERAADAAIRRAERGMRRSARRGPIRSTTVTTPARKKATSEEQLKILKMVEQGIITVDEASSLLEALES
jgi:DUF4097 and DUF4098 domain-containing protein YvlB